MRIAAGGGWRVCRPGWSFALVAFVLQQQAQQPPPQATQPAPPATEVYVARLGIDTGPLTGGAADNISVVIRQTVLQLLTPDSMRGRVTAVSVIFIGSSNELGEFESGVVAAWLGAVPAALLGGIATILIALTWMRLFPALRKVERLE